MLDKLLVTIFGKEWGPKLFLSVMFVSLVFFWWLLLYSHGVDIHH